MLEDLKVVFLLEEIDLANKPPGFSEISPTGRVPVLVDGPLKLYESFVLIQYVAEKYGLENAFAADAGLRARQRLAMLQFDAVVVPSLFGSLKHGEGFKPPATLDRELDELERTCAETGVPSLLAYHLAPFWLRFGWLREHVGLMQRLDSRRALVAWLDRAVAQPSIQKTAPEREENVRQLLARFGPPTRSTVGAGPATPPAVH